MRRVPVAVPSLQEQGVGTLRTACVGPTGADLDAVCAPGSPVLVLLHSFDSRWVGGWARLVPADAPAL